MKKCSKCKESKEKNKFSKNKNQNDGLQSYCKQCAKSYQKDNLHQWKDYNKKHYQLNKEIHNQRTKSYYENHKEDHNQRMKSYREKNPNYMKEWYSKNQEEYNQKQREKWNNNPVHRLKSNIRTRIYQAIKNKSESTFNLLGCPIEEYKLYLEQQFDKNMNWDNYGTYWEIDHTIPLSKDGSFHYTNTTPMIISENRKKSNK
jgi:hypothetical protein